MKNYISKNISYLVHKSRLGQDEFGQLFDLNKGLIGKYINNISLPKIETLVKICDHFNITLDSLVRENLLEKNEVDKINKIDEPHENYIISPRYVEMLEKQNKLFENALQDKDKIIHTLEEKLGLHEKNRRA